MRKGWTALVLCLCLLLAMALPAQAAEKPQSLTIRSREEFLAFAENCRIDSYSQNLEVSLETDIDLMGTGFAGIPIFCGSFQGNGHTIKGLNLSAEGSYQGLFRYLTETAAVQDLKVIGTLQPGGSRANIGGIAGSNGGSILRCSFTGYVSGGDGVGGIAGTNLLSGTIEACTVSGKIYGTHFVGGIAGENAGVLRHCENKASVNDSAQKNTVELSDITIASITGSEAAGTVTDIGGIAGTSKGVIRSCENHGNVGYRQMGYNIGGIVGTQSGSVLNCRNYGQVHGRKDVGGIVGQLEPTALIAFEADTIQILEKQLDSMGATINATASNVQGTGDKLATQVDELEDYVSDAMDAVGTLLPDPENPEPPDEDTLQAAQNAISTSVSGMTETLKGMSETTYRSVGALSNNLHVLESQINAMRSTLGNASQTLGGSITDVSDLDTAENLTGKVSGCKNTGAVLADRNAGGIAGTMALENDLDVEEDWSILGENSLNFKSELRAVILDCINEAQVTCKKQKGGGIAGWQALGLVKDCLNTGSLDALGAEYVGGVSGHSLGYIRSSYAKCQIAAGRYAGGIAGAARVVTDCRSITGITGAPENVGAVLGRHQEGYGTLEQPIAGNYYFAPNQDPGAIDGISYAAQAEPLNREDFLALESLPETFREVHVHFSYPNGMELCIPVPLGESIPMEKVPQLPEQKGCEASWKGLQEGDLAAILYDIRYEVQYTGKKTVIQTVESGNAPELLLQGLFGEAAKLERQPWEDTVPVKDGESLLGAWQFAVTEAESITGIRIRLPETCAAGEVKLLLLDRDGTWRQGLPAADGSYLTAPLEAGDQGYALVRIPSYRELALIVAAAVLIVAVFGLVFQRKEKRATQER